MRMTTTATTMTTTRILELVFMVCLFLGKHIMTCWGALQANQNTPMQQQQALPATASLRASVSKSAQQLRQSQSQSQSQQDHPLRRRRLCEANGAGNYGILQGSTPRFVNFYYQGVFLPTTTQTQIDINILPELERALLNGLLPNFFDCPNDVPLTNDVLGLSMNLEDQIVTSLPCVRGPNANCYTFEGRMFLFSPTLPSNEAAAALLNPIIQQYMESTTGSDSLSNVDPRIVFLDYVEIVDGVPVKPSQRPSVVPSGEPSALPSLAPSSAPLAPTRSPTPVPTPVLSASPVATREGELPTSSPTAVNSAGVANKSNDGDGGDDEFLFAWWIWLIIGVGALLACCVCVFCWMQRSNQGGGGGLSPPKKPRRNSPKKKPIHNAPPEAPESYVPPGAEGAYAPPLSFPVVDKPEADPSINSQDLGGFDINSSQQEYIPGEEYAESEDEDDDIDVYGEQEEEYYDEGEEGEFEGEYEEEYEGEYEDQYEQGVDQYEPTEEYQQEYEQGDEYEEEGEFEDEGEFEEEGEFEGEYEDEYEGDENDYEDGETFDEEEYTEEYEEESLPVDAEQQQQNDWAKSGLDGGRSAGSF